MGGIYIGVYEYDATIGQKAAMIGFIVAGCIVGSLILIALFMGFFLESK